MFTLSRTHHQPIGRHSASVLALALTLLFPALAQAAGLSGTVKNPSSAAVSGAEVGVYRFNLEEWHQPNQYMVEPVQETLTDESGAFSFSGLPTRDAYRVVVQKDGFQPHVITGLVLPDTGQMDALEVELVSVEPILIYTETPDGTRVPNTSVAIWNKLEGIDGYIILEDVTTDENGVLEYYAHPDARVHIHYREEGYARVFSGWGDHDGQYTLVLRKGQTITGQVFDNTGIPRQNVEVHAQAVSYRWRAHVYTRTARQTYTDDEGNFELNNLAEGEYYVVGMLDGFTQAEAGPIHLKSAGLDGVELELEPGFNLQGRLLTQSGDPAPGAYVNQQPDWNTYAGVNAYHYVDPFWPRWFPFGTCKTDEEGRFSYPPAADRGYTLWVVYPPNPYWLERMTHYTRQQEEEVTVRMGSTLARHAAQTNSTGSKFMERLGQLFGGGGGSSPALLFETPPEIRGHVKRADGSPGFPARLTVRSDAWDFEDWAFYVDQNGYYRAQLPEGLAYGDSNKLPITISARSADALRATQEHSLVLSASVTTLDLTLTEDDVIVGTVRNKAGNPVGGARIEAFLTSQYNEEDEDIRPESWARSDDSGKFKLPGLKAGTEYRIGALAKGYGVGILPRVAAGEENADLRLPQEAIVKGRVVNPDGTPGYHAYVEYHYGDKHKALEFMANRFDYDATYSQQNGEFEIRQLTTRGPVDLVLTVKAFGEEPSPQPTVVTLEEGQVVDDVVMTLPGGVNIKGRITDAETGEPITEVDVHRRVEGYFVEKIRPDANGYYEFNDLQLEDFRIIVEATGYDHDMVVFEPDEEPPSFDFPLAKSSAIQGKVVDLQNNPLPGVRIDLTGVMGNVQVGDQGRMRWMTRAYTDDTGEFTITGFKPGQEISVRFIYRDHEMRRYWTMPEQPDSEPRVVVIGKYASISGYVMNPDGEMRKGGRVRLNWHAGPDSERSHQNQGTYKDGRFLFDRLDPGTYSVSYYKPRDMWPQDDSERVTVEPGDHVEDLKVVAVLVSREERKNQPNPRLTVKGRVDLTGLDLPEAHSYGWVKPMLGEYYTRQQQKQLRKRNHTFQFNTTGMRITDHIYDVIVQGPGLATEIVHDVSPPMDDLVIRPKKEGFIKGKVVDAETGAAITEFRVGVFYPWNPNTPAWHKAFMGQYSIGQIGDFITRLQVRADGYNPSSTVPVIGKAETTVTPETIQLRPGIEVRGNVRDAEGEPVANARVLFRLDPSEPESLNWGEDTTGPDGKFAIDGLRMGTMFVTVRHDNFNDIESQDVLLPPKGGELNLELSARGMLVVSVRSDWGWTNKDAKVTANGMEVPWVWASQNHQLADLKPGEVTVKVAPYVEGMKELTQKTVIKAGERSHVLFDGSGRELPDPEPIEVTGSYAENFEEGPQWTSTYEGHWGGLGEWVIKQGGYSGNYMESKRDKEGTSIRVLVFKVEENRDMELSAWLRAPEMKNGHYWMEFSYRLGKHDGRDFDKFDWEWEQIHKFDSKNEAMNGNNNEWTRYAANFNTGPFEYVTVGFKMGSLGSGAPPLGWDSLVLN